MIQSMSANYIFLLLNIEKIEKIEFNYANMGYVQYNTTTKQTIP